MILSACHGESEWRIKFDGLQSVNVKILDEGFLKTFEINNSLILRLVQNNSYTIMMKASANIGNLVLEKEVDNTGIIKFRFPCQFNTYHIYFYVICHIIKYSTLIAYTYLKFEKLSYHKETSNLVSFNFSLPCHHMVETYRMNLLTITKQANVTIKLKQFKKFKNLPLKYNFKQNGIYKLSFQFRICKAWSDETIKHVKIGNDSIIFINRSTYKNKPSLSIMVFPKKLNENGGTVNGMMKLDLSQKNVLIFKKTLKNAKIPKFNYKISVFIIIYRHKSNESEARRNITYIIAYKTPEMKQFYVRFIFHHESIWKKKRIFTKPSLESFEKFLQEIEEYPNHFVRQYKEEKLLV
ncbi:uncharacterized protein LOC135924810 isoform X2 [Gordionus sp. m RMFG-2023]|uniref:uncharacterized protein LOC135924810 isoform X2 n=1 Tax=Gordionus sp. m RMFG-2023 TaxID=3053472 RepID=UPI0031FCF252